MNPEDQENHSPEAAFGKDASSEGVHHLEFDCLLEEEWERLCDMATD
jgi:hypothetical protein